MLLLRIKQYPKYFLWLAVGLVIITLLFLTFFYNKRQSVIIKKIASSELALSDSLGMPYGILYHQNKILILDKKPIGSNNQVAIYDTKTGKLISAFGRSGPGPGEFLSVKSIAENVVNPKLITIFDSGLLRFSVFDISFPTKVKLISTYNLKRGATYCPVFINDSIIASLGYEYSQGKFALFDTLGKIREYLGEPLPGRLSNSPMTVHQQAMVGRLKVTPDGSKIIITSQLSA